MHRSQLLHRMEQRWNRTAKWWISNNRHSFFLLQKFTHALKAVCAVEEVREHVVQCEGFRLEEVRLQKTVFSFSFTRALPNLASISNRNVGAPLARRHSNSRGAPMHTHASYLLTMD